MLPPSYQAPWTLEGIVAGNGFLRALGARFEALDGSGAVFTLDAGPEHRNAEDRIHGGLLAALLDIACGFSVRFDGARNALLPSVTLSLAVSFLAPARDNRLTVHGRVVGGGRQILFTRGEVLDGGGTPIAMANGTFKRLGRPASSHGKDNS